MTEEKVKYNAEFKDLNELKKRFEEVGGDWKEALDKIKKAAGGKDIAAAMKEGWSIADFAKILFGGDDDKETKPPKQNPSQAVEYGFTEAPASFNVKAISPAGFDMMLTLRDADTMALMKRMHEALAWLIGKGYQPTGRRSGGNNGNAQADNGNQGEAPLCPTHNKAMRASKHRDGEWYCPVKIAEDDGTGKPVYCKQKVKK
jgi:hypothetical protein